MISTPCVLPPNLLSTTSMIFQGFFSFFFFTFFLFFLLLLFFSQPVRKVIHLVHKYNELSGEIKVLHSFISSLFVFISFHSWKINTCRLPTHSMPDRTPASICPRPTLFPSSLGSSSTSLTLITLLRMLLIIIYS